MLHMGHIIPGPLGENRTAAVCFHYFNFLSENVTQSSEIESADFIYKFNRFMVIYCIGKIV